MPIYFSRMSTPPTNPDTVEQTNDATSLRRVEITGPSMPVRQARFEGVNLAQSRLTCMDGRLPWPSPGCVTVKVHYVAVNRTDASPRLVRMGNRGPFAFETGLEVIARFHCSRWLVTHSILEQVVCEVLSDRVGANVPPLPGKFFAFGCERFENVVAEYYVSTQSLFSLCISDSRDGTQ